jgi:hypothetical protein
LQTTLPVPYQSDVADEARDQKSPQPTGGVGREKVGPEEVEVGGRKRKWILYACWSDGAGNYVDPDWGFFTCWKCGVTYCVHADGSLGSYM